jgi:hypothetical protein
MATRQRRCLATPFYRKFRCFYGSFTARLHGSYAGVSFSSTPCTFVAHGFALSPSGSRRVIGIGWSSSLQKVPRDCNYQIKSRWVAHSDGAHGPGHNGDTSHDGGAAQGVCATGATQVRARTRWHSLFLLQLATAPKTQSVLRRPQTPSPFSSHQADWRAHNRPFVLRKPCHPNALTDARWDHAVTRHCQR